MSLPIIDISSHNTISSWSNVASNVSGVIMRLGYRGYGSGKIVYDSKYTTHLAKVKAYKIPYGVYFFPTSITTAEAEEEAEFIIKAVSGLSLSFPIYLDSEIADVTNKSGRSDNLDKATRTALLKVILTKLKTKGYDCGVYASKSWLTSNLNMSSLSGYKVWVAQYNTSCTYSGTYTMWQYSSSATISGVSGKCDVSKLKESSSSSTTYTQTQFIKDVQSAIGVTVDGIAGSKTLNATVTVSATVNRKHAVVKPLQKYLNALGYNCGTVDGIAGAKFTTAVKAYQKANGCTVDGVITARAKTWKKLLGLA